MVHLYVLVIRSTDNHIVISQANLILTFCPRTDTAQIAYIVHLRLRVFSSSFAVRLEVMLALVRARTILVHIHARDFGFRIRSGGTLLIQPLRHPGLSDICVCGTVMSREYALCWYKSARSEQGDVSRSGGACFDSRYLVVWENIHLIWDVCCMSARVALPERLVVRSICDG